MCISRDCKPKAKCNEQLRLIRLRLRNENRDFPQFREEIVKLKKITKIEIQYFNEIEVLFVNETDNFSREDGKKVEDSLTGLIIKNQDIFDTGRVRGFITHKSLRNLMYGTDDYEEFEAMIIDAKDQIKIERDYSRKFEKLFQSLNVTVGPIGQHGKFISTFLQKADERATNIAAADLLM